MRDFDKDFARMRDEHAKMATTAKRAAVLSTIAGLLVVALLCWTAIRVAEILAGC